VDSDEHARSTGTQRDLRQRLCGALGAAGGPPHGGRRRLFVDGDRAMVAAPSDADAGVRSTRHSTPNDDIDVVGG